VAGLGLEPRRVRRAGVLAHEGGDGVVEGLAGGSGWIYAASGQFRPDLVEAIGAAPLGPSDWVVGDISTLTGAPEKALAARGLTCRDFGGITDCWTPGS